jgi:branched-chain amino acid transport system ATP-binding protein
VSPPALRVTGLEAGHATVRAVHGIDLTVEAGQVVALLGPNGAGKTTTLDTIAGILPRLGGSVEVFGTPTTQLSPQAIARLGVAYVPERRGLFDQLTVFENLRIRARGRAGARRVLDDFPVLSALARRRAGLLSGGEQQLLALACAMTMRPRLLMVDEMTAGLAPTVIADLTNVMRRMVAEGVAVLFVEQHIHVALDLADFAYVLRSGQCVLSDRCDVLSGRLGALQDSYFDHTHSGGGW